MDKKLLRLVPSLTIAAGVIAATAIEKAGPLGGWRFALGALTFAAGILGADAVGSAGRSGQIAISRVAILLSSGFLLAVWICREPAFLALTIPAIASMVWLAGQGTAKEDGKLCRESR